jgi:hypothetical protein
MSETKPTNWQLRADEVLAVLLREQDAHHTACFEYGVIALDFPPGPHRQTFKAIHALRMAKEPVHLTALQEKAPDVPDTWLAARWAMYTKALARDVFIDNIQHLKQYGLAASNIDILSWALTALRTVTSEEARAEIAANVITALGMGIAEGVNDATAASAGARFDELMSSPPPPAIRTGIPFIDTISGGLQRDQIWWFVGAYKSGKSSLMRNVLINAAEAGASVTLAGFEGSQKMAIAQIVAMFAAAWLYKNGHHAQRDKHGVPLGNLSASILLQMGNNYKRLLHPLQVEAVSQGSARFKALGDRLRIYDKTRVNGGLSDLNTLHALIMRDKQMYGVDVVAVDYLQLISGGGRSTYEKVSYHSTMLQEYALKYGINMLVLAQRNEEAINGSGDSYSPGVKGGGDAPSTADYLFVIQHKKDADASPGLTVKLTHSRHAPPSRAMDLPTHLPTGLILPHETLNLATYGTTPIALENV